MASFGLFMLALVALLHGSHCQTSNPLPTTAQPATTNGPITTQLNTTTQPTTTTTEPPPKHGIVLSSYFSFLSENLVSFVPALPWDLDTFDGEVQGMGFEGRGDQRFSSCAVDYREKTVFMYDRNGYQILIGEGLLNSSLNENSANFSALYFGSGVGDFKMTHDWISNNLYIVDNGFNQVLMVYGAPMESNGAYALILNSHLDQPVGMTLDPQEGCLFVANVKSGKITKCSLTGKNAHYLSITTDLKDPYDVSADLKDKKLYVIDGSKIYRMDYNGDNVEKLVSKPNADFLAIEVFRDTFMAVEYYSGQLYVFNQTDGTEITEPFGTDEYSDVCMFHEDAQPMFNDGSACKDKGCQHLCVVEPPNFTGTCVCWEGYDLDNDGIKCIENGGPYVRVIVLTDGDQICILNYRAFADFHESFLENMNCFYSRTTASSDPTQNQDPIKIIELKSATREVFVATKNAMYKCPLDDQAPTLEPVMSITGFFGDMSYDWMSDNMYFTNTEAGTVNVFSMETSTLVTLASNLIDLGDVLVVPHFKKVYWGSKINETNGKVTMADLDGGNVKDIYTSQGVVSRFVNDVDGGRIFFHEEGSFYDYIRAFNYTGGEVDTKNYLYGPITAYTIYKNYYATTSRSGDQTTSIFEAGINENGYSRNKGEFPSNMDSIVDVKVHDEDLQASAPGPCLFLNGGCDGACFPEVSTRICECPVGFTLDSDNESCDSELVLDDFLLVADLTYDAIYQLQLDAVAPVQGVRIGSDTGISSVMYNYLRNTIVYTANQELWESNMRAAEQHVDRVILPDYLDGAGYTNPDRTALDSSTGNIYYTNSDKGVIGVLAPDRRHTTLKMSSTLLWSPRDIALDVERGLQFWVDMGLFGYKAGLYRSNMDGSDDKNIGSSLVFGLPVGVALDMKNKKVYVTEADEDKVYVCHYNGSNPVVIHEDKGASLEDIHLNGIYLYISAWNRDFIIRLNTNDIGDVMKIGEGNGLGRLNGIDVYRSSTSFIARSACSTKNGGCTHFCFPTPTGHTCGCEDLYTLFADNKTCSNVPVCNTTIPNVVFPSACVPTNGVSCRFTCAEMYKPKAGLTDTLNCMNTTWDFEEPCEEILCTEVVPNGNFDDECNVTVGSICSDIRCNPGYELLSDVTFVECKATGTWDVSPNKLCEEKCPDGLIKNGSLVLPCERKPGVRCTFTCIGNNKPLDDDAEITCQAGSTWNRNTNDVCEEIMCPASISHGTVLNECRRNVGSKCTKFSCNNGYESMVNVAMLTCGTNGLWTGTVNPADICEEKCPDGIENGRLVPCVRSPDATCKFTCANTHRPRDDDTEITCQSGSQWNRDPTTVCEEIICPKKIDEATIEVNCSRKVGERCLYSCGGDYIINVKVIHQTCQRSGGWKNTGNPGDALCVESVPGQELEQHKRNFTTLLSALVPICVVLLIVVIILTVYIFRMKGKSVSGKDASYRFDNSAQSGSGGVSGFENPQYANAQEAGQATGGTNGDRDVGYTKFDNDRVELSLEDKF